MHLRLLAALTLVAAFGAHATTAQQELMRTCNAEAKGTKRRSKPLLQLGAALLTRTKGCS